MEHITREEQQNVFNEQVFHYNYHDCLDIADFFDVSFSESASNQTHLISWSDPVQDKGKQDWPKIHSIEEGILQIIDSSHKCEMSINHLKNGMNITMHSCSPEEYKGLRLVHLLTACADAISQGENDLVEIVLSRLTELVSPTGTSMERVAYYLSHSLRQAHLTLLGDMFNGYNSATENPNYVQSLSLLNMVFPYIRFAHFTANQSILEAVTLYVEIEEDPNAQLNAGAVSGSWVLWVIDFDIKEGLQWPPLMEALKSETSRLCGFRLTAIKWHDVDDSEQFSCKNTERRLSEYASSLGIHFTFEEMELRNLKGGFRRNGNEVVAVNCMWELPHMCKRSKEQLLGFFQGLRDLKPVIVTVGSGPAGMDGHEKLNFRERFSKCMRNLCAVFDSSQVGLPEKYGLARTNMENLFLGPMVCRSMNYVADNQEYDFIPVMEVALKSGFTQCDISHRNMLYTKYILAASEVGRLHSVELMGKHQLLLKLNSTCLVCFSSFRVS